MDLALLGARTYNQLHSEAKTLLLFKDFFVDREKRSFPKEFMIIQRSQEYKEQCYIEGKEGALKEDRKL